MDHPHSLRQGLLALFVSACIVGCSTSDPVDPASPDTSPFAKGGSEGITAVLTPEEIADLVYIREEEKLARDIYSAMFEKWNKNIFDNIAQSEQIHMDAILTLLNRYGILDPAKDNGPGVFTDPTLQELYLKLLEQGLGSFEEAIAVGVLIEETDIIDLGNAIADADNRDIVRVYEQLIQGSERHLQAFTRHLTESTRHLKAF